MPIYTCVTALEETMQARRLCTLLLPALALCLAARPAWAQDKGSPEDKDAIAKSAEAFVEAFHNGDAKALAAFWTPDGDFTDQTGHTLKGRQAIEKAFSTFFAENKGLKVHIHSNSLRFLTPDVAVEDGVTKVFAPDGSPPSSARYTIVHVKSDNQWLLGSVREAIFTPASNYQHLRPLEWLAGNWVSEGGKDGKGVVDRISFTWGMNQNFLLGHFSQVHGAVDVGSFEQRILWDPVAKKIRSFAFDDTGGFGEGSWTRDGKTWQIKSNVVLRDGRKLAATFILRPIDANNITLQVTDRSIDGKEAPGAREIKLKRAL
jgi:uncharacterized protein (TIGR02246 family)